MPSQYEEQIESLLSQMSLEEKSHMCHAIEGFASGGCERLGIPPLTLSDGPHGVRHELHPHSWDPIGGGEDQGTYLPAGTSTAATWNRELARKFGQVLGGEARDRGKDVILGPGVNIIRTPLCGRNFEYYSEDPFLAASLVVPCVEGIQKMGTACCVKHYALNNQELNRHGVDADPDDRTLREIYLPAFETAARAGAWTFMGAYNLYRGQHCCHNRRLINEILKGEWEWDGVVISDWGGTHDTIEAATCGLDIEMGGGSDYDRYHLAEPTIAAVRDGRVDEAAVDDKARRILRLMFRLGKLGNADRPAGARNTAEHQRVALDIARESVVLLKNEDDFLPLKLEGVKTVAVIGENADAAHAGGGGSSQVPALYEVTPLEGLKKALGDTVEIRTAKGYPLTKFCHNEIPAELLGVVEEGSGVRGWNMQQFSRRRTPGEPAAERTVSQPQLTWTPESLPEFAGEGGQFSARWIATVTPAESGEYELALLGSDYSDIRIDGRTVINIWGNPLPDVRTAKVEMEGGRCYEITVTLDAKGDSGEVRVGWFAPSDERPEPESELLDEAVAVAKDADLVVFVGGLNHIHDCEGSDRGQLALSDGQDTLIDALAAANPNLAVVMVAGSPVAMPWADKARAIVWAGYEGMEGGTAIAEVLCGLANPSGKLPYTLPRSLSDSPAHALDDYHADRCEYAEGVLVGYRWFDAKAIQPLYPFGHGLSYTQFEYDRLAVEKTDDGEAVARVTFTVRNAGSLAGAEVAQLYVGKRDSSVDRAMRELKGFEKVLLAPGEEKQITLELTRRGLSFWDVQQNGWVAEPGRYAIEVGSSSRDIRLRGEFELGE
ncbi:MAG: glycoside hydrolase family 3 C-terminal domain-containing protein [Phycisphaerae bacterium]